MAETTKISWTDATWNIARGCTKVDEDCKYCYMYRESLNETRYNPFKIVKTKTVFNLPLRIKEPSKIFVSSLTDVFHEGCDEFRNEMWDIIRKCPQHTFQVLTKRPERIADHLPEDWGGGWNNVWLGTSVGSQKGMKRIFELLKVDCKTRFVSFEPLHEKIGMNLDIGDLCELHWAIIGGESGNENGKYLYRPCKVEWIEELINDLTPTTAIFVKQLGTHLAKEMKMSDRHGANIEEFPHKLRIREFPSA
jgi:protein gp37